MLPARKLRGKIRVRKIPETRGSGRRPNDPRMSSGNRPSEDWSLVTLTENI